METLHNDQLDETVYLAKTPAGVRVALVNKPGFSTAAGYFGLRFGSTDTRFRTAQGETLEVPDGSAHFLEHKLFEGRQEKVFDRFGRLGADFNGGTGFRSTSYYFSTASRFEECLEVLLDFVQHPLITEERVEKEKGIIEQEVRMYEDHPHFRGLFLLHRALFHEHPIRIPPGGFVDSVRATTAEDLQACFDHFYRPQNLRLSLAGDFDPQAMLERVEALLDPPVESNIGGGATSLYAAEPKAPAETRLEENFAVSRPHIWIGWREQQGPGTRDALVRHRVLSSLAMDFCFDHSSDYHENLYQNGIVDDTFDGHYSCDFDYGYAMASGVSDDPDKFISGVQEAAQRFVQDGPKPEQLERVRRSAWGSMVSGLQTPSAIASSILYALLEGVEPFSVLKVLESVTLEDVTQRARELFTPSRCAVAMLKPQG